MNYLYQNIYRYDIENNDYVLNTPLLGIINLPSNTRIFGAIDDIVSNDWIIVTTNLKDNWNVKHIESKDIPANVQTEIAVVNDFVDSNSYNLLFTIQYTLCSFLSFATSDYNNITESDNIIIDCICYSNHAGNFASYRITQYLKKQYINTINITHTKNLNSLLNKITIYVKSTFPVKLRAPRIINDGNKAYTYLYFINI